MHKNILKLHNRNEIVHKYICKILQLKELFTQFLNYLLIFFIHFLVGDKYKHIQARKIKAQSDLVASLAHHYVTHDQLRRGRARLGWNLGLAANLTHALVCVTPASPCITQSQSNDQDFS